MDAPGEIPAWTVDEFIHIAEVQQRREAEAAATANRVMFGDTNAFATATWFERYANKRHPEVDAIGARDIVDLYLVPAPDIPFVQDGVRDGEKIRDWMHARFVELIEASGTPYVLITGPYEARLPKAIAAVDTLLALSGSPRPRADIRVRRAAPDDAGQLAHIGVATFIESYTEIIDGANMAAHCTRQHSQAVYEAYLANPQVSVWLAEYNETGAPVGYAVNCPPDLPIPIQPGDVELKRIYALSRFHGSGAGKALMDAATADAKARGASRLLLGTYEENHRAVAFYKKHGFELAGTRQFQVGERLYDDIVMAKRL
jgi:diamine N-acetyltransferase